MGKIAKVELKGMLDQNPLRKPIRLSDVTLQNMDLTGWNLQNIDFSWSNFEHVILDSADMSGSNISNTLFADSSFRGAILKGVDAYAATLRYCDLSGANIEGADVRCANLEHAILDNVRFNEETQGFKLHCPETGAFVAWKKCMDYRMVQLLIPADAKRTSATMPTCRCNKAKVLSIKSIDYKESYEWAHSFVDENFIYRVGEIAEVKNFNEDRWMDSTTGIHFFITRDEAIAY